MKQLYLLGKKGMFLHAPGEVWLVFYCSCCQPSKFAAFSLLNFHA